MTVAWKALAPYRPLDPGSPAYVPPPSGAGERIARWVAAGGATVLLGGPVGVGKSTELARAAVLLEATRVACLVQLDRLEDMERITPHRTQMLVAGIVARIALQRGLNLSDTLRDVLHRRGVLGLEHVRQAGGSLAQETPKAILEVTLGEVSRLAGKPVALLVDGLEKCPEPIGRGVFGALAEVDESVDVVVVVPWYAAFGPGAALVVRPGERLVAVRPPPVEGPSAELGRTFLRGVLAKRLDFDPVFFEPRARPAAAPYMELPDLVTRASVASGGIVRTFLQIMLEAATYARLRRDAEWPDAMDVTDAISEHEAFLHRLLLPGDRELLKRADGTDGIEVELGAKVRLMAHGLLLEVEEEGRTVLRPHPLVRHPSLGAWHA